METLVLDGKEFVKASKAARDLGYTSDYVGQLCRSGAITAHLVGRTWYVHFDELSGHKVEKKRNARVKAREKAKKTIEDYRQKQSSLQVSQGLRQDISKVQYMNDETELIPTMRHLTVREDKNQNVSKEYHYDDAVEKPEMVIENKDKKVFMHGQVEIIDAEYEDSDDMDSVFLKPKIIDSVNKDETYKKIRTTKQQNADNQIHNTMTSDFSKKLNTRDIAVDNNATITAFENIETTPQDASFRKGSKNKVNFYIRLGIVYTLLILGVCLISFFSVTLYSSMRYSVDEYTQFEIRYDKDYNKIIDNIRYKI